MQIASQPDHKVYPRLKFPILLVILATLMGWMGHNYTRPVAAASFAPTQWTYALPADPCPNTNHNDCHAGSPALADIDGDGFDDVVAVTNKGHVVVIKHNGVRLWDTDVAPFFGMAPGTNEIHSSPAVADLDNNGHPEIVVGVGTFNGQVCTQGGVIVLDHLGRVKPGWPFFSADDETTPNGCPDTIFATPALGDLDNDGDLEITAAGFDKRVYAWHHDGTLLPGFPPPSYHYQRFPTWPNLANRLADNTWGSTVHADLDNDGYLDILIGSSEGNFDDRYGGDSGGWTCPYRLPSGWSPGYCGGSLYAFDRFGELLPGFPRYFLEAIGSTPAVADTNGDGALEIYVGLSSFYYDNSPDHPRYGFKLYGLDTQGNDLHGWAGGKNVGGATPATPSIGDIAGDKKLEIIVAATDLKLYAWHSGGNGVAGFPMKPLTQTGKSFLKYEHGVSFPLADYDSDGKMEIFVNQTWVVVVVDGNGQQLTSTNYPYDPRPTFYAEGNLFNTPAVGDIDNDGRLELVATNSHVFVWDLPDSQDLVHWSNFKCDSTRASRYCQHLLALYPPQVTILHQVGSGGKAIYSADLLNTGMGPVSWSANTPSTFSVSPSAGTLASGNSAELTVSIPTNGLSKGTYHLGAYRIEPTGDEYLANDVDQDVTLVIGDLTHFLFPIIAR